MENRSEEFAQQIAGVLRDAGISFKANIAVEGLKADFVVSDRSGDFVIIEAKAWNPTKDNIERAARQAALYRAAAKADKAYVVMNNLETGNPSEGVLSVSELVEALLSDAGALRTRSGAVREFQQSERMVFAAMPFSSEYDDTFFVAMSFAAKSVDAVCRRVDLQDFDGDVVPEIKRMIQSSIAVIADLSDSRPNVLYETGYAHALERPTVHICSTPVDLLPFDVRNWNTLQYKAGQTFAFRDRLGARLKALLAMPLGRS